MLVLIKFQKHFIFKNKNYNFYSISNVRFELNKNFYVVIVNTNIAVVQIKNATNKFCILFKNAKIKQLRDYNEKKCYFVKTKNRFLTVVFVVE